MADYISTLTGQQMDAALIDMAQHNSEAYAVGERDGVPVTPSDPTYHNNSKYWATVAGDMVEGTGIEDPNDDGNLIVNLPSGDSESWAVRTDIAQTLSESEKAQARANISAGGTNINILDNPWLGSTYAVNQRKVSGTVSTANIYFYDRWKTSATGDATIAAEYLTIGAGSGLVQYFECTRLISGKTYTLSVLDSNGTVYTASGVLTTTNGGTSVWQIDKTVAQNVWLGVRQYNANLMDVTITTVNGVSIKAIKLELGTACTIGNDVPPNYADELAKCQHYFQRIVIALNQPFMTGTSWSATEIRGFVPLASPLAKEVVSISTDCTFVAIGLGGSANVSALAVQGYKPSNGFINLIATSSGLSGQNIYQIRSNSNGHIDLSAEL